MSEAGPGSALTETFETPRLLAEFEDSADSGRVMALALHPFVIGQAFRHRYLDLALEYLADHPGVWLTTSDEIAEHYARTTADQEG